MYVALVSGETDTEVALQSQVFDRFIHSGPDLAKFTMNGASNCVVFQVKSKQTTDEG